MLDTFVAIVLGNALVAVLFALGVVLLSRWCHKPALLHGLWVVVLLKLVTPPMITIPIPVQMSEFVPNPVFEETTVGQPETSWPSRPAPVAEMGRPVDRPTSESIFNPTIVIDAPPKPDNVSERDTVGERSEEYAFQPNDSTDIEVTDTGNLPLRVATERSPLAVESPYHSTGFPAAAPGGGGKISKMEPTPGPNRRAVAWFLISVWAAGAFVVFFISWRQIWRFERFLRSAAPADHHLNQKVERLAQRMGLPRGSDVYLLRGTVSPMLWGFGWRPRLLLPAELLNQLNEESTDTLILHELAHLRRGDHWVRMLELLCLCIYWWHPVVWWGRKQLRIVEEECCDAFVVEHCRGGVYARALLATVDFLSNQPVAMPPAASGMGQLDFLKRRLTMIMQGGVSARLAGLPKFMLLVVSVVGLSVLPRVVAETAVAESEADTDEAAPSESAETPEDFKPDSEKQARSAPREPRLLIGQEPIEFEKTPRGYPTPQLEVRDLEFSPDGKLLAAGYGRWDSAGEIVIYDFAKKQVLQKFPTPKGVASVTFSPDGKYLAASYWNTHLEIRETETWKIVAEKSTGSKITRLDFSPDGKYLAAASEAGLLSMWAVGAWDNERSFEGEWFRFQKVAFSPDSKLLVAVGGSFNQPQFGRGLVFDVESGKTIAQFDSPGSVFAGVAFSPDGKELATGVFGQGVYFYETRTGKSLASLSLPGTVRDLEYYEDGRLAAACGDRAVYLIKDRAIERQLVGHEDEAISATFTPDGELLVTGAEDSLIRIWNPNTGVPLETLRPHETLEDTQEAVVAIAHSPNGEYVVTTHEDGSVRLRTAESGQLLRGLKGHQDIVSTVAFSPDSQILATGSYDQTVKLWKVTTGEQIRDLKGHNNWVFSVRFSPDGKTLASAGYDKTIHLWNVETGETVGVLKGHSAAVRSVAFSPDGQKLASGSSDRSVRVWDLKTRQSLQEFKGHTAAVRAVDYAPDGSRIASGSEDQTIRLWNPNTGETTKELKGHQGMVWTLAFSPRGRTLASGGFDNNVIIWNASTGTALQTLNAHQDVLTSLSYAPNTSALVTGSYDKTLKLWPAVEPPMPALADLNLSDGSNTPHMRFVVFTPDGKRMITGNQNRQIRLWDLETGRVMKQVLTPRGIGFGALDGTGKLLATSNYGGGSYLFDAESLELLKTFHNEGKEHTTVAVSPNGKIVASGALDGSITLWAVDSGEKLRELPKLNLPIGALDFSPDGKLLVSGSGSFKESTTAGTVKLWDTETGKEIADLLGPTHKIRPVKFSPDGQTVIAGGSQTELLVYRVASKELSRRISFGTDITSAAFLPDSQHVILGGWDGRVELWNVETGTRTARYEGHQPAERNHRLVFDVSAAVDGSVVASAGGDGHVKLWPATNLAPIKALMTIDNPNTEVLHVAMSPDGMRMVISKTDKTLQILETKTGKVLQTIDKLNTACSGLSFAPDGKTFAGGMMDGRVLIWDAETGQELHTMAGHEGGTRRLAFSPNGQWLASGGWDETAAVWNTADGALRYRIPKQGLAVSDVKFSPEGKLLITATGSFRDWRKPGTMKIWKADDGTSFGEVGSHEAEIKGILFDAGGKHLISYGGNGAKVWDRINRKLLRSIGPGTTVTAAFLSPDGDSLYVGDSQGRMTIYDVNSGNTKQTLEGHDALIHSLASSADGTLIASVSKSGTVKLWPGSRIPGHRPLAQIMDDPQHSRTIAYSPNGQWLAVGGRKKTINLYDVSTLKHVRTLEGHNGLLFRLVFTPDSRSLLSASSDGTVRLWNASDGQGIAKWTVHQGKLANVRGLAVSPDGRQIAAGNDNGEICVWDRESRKELYRLPPASLPVTGVAFSPDGKLLATCTGNWQEWKTPGKLKLWSAQTGEAIATLGPHGGEIKGVLFNRDGKTLISYGSDQSLRIWDVAARRLLRKQDFPHNLSATALVNEETLLIGDTVGTLYLTDFQAGTLKGQTRGHYTYLSEIAVAPDESQFATVGHDGLFKTWSMHLPQLAVQHLPARKADAAHLAERIRTWQPQSSGGDSTLSLRKEKSFAPHGDKVWFAVFSPDGKTLATGGADKTVKLWHAETMEVLHTLTGHKSFTSHAAFSPDGKKLATVSWELDRTVKLWDVQTGKLLASAEAHEGGCRRVAFSPDGQFIATACEDHVLRLFNSDLAFSQSIDVGLNVSSVAFSPDSQILAIGTGSWRDKKPGRITLYDPETGKKIRELENSTGYVFQLQFLKDGKHLLAGNAGAGCAVWNLETGAMETIYRQEQDTRWVEIDREEKRLVACSKPGIVHVWNRDAIQPIVSIKASEEFIHCATFSPDARRIFVGDEAGKLTIWEIINSNSAQVATSSDPGDK